MNLSRNSLYALIFAACLGGYLWFYMSLNDSRAHRDSVEVCFIKHVTSLPCPSCGATRSVISIAQGDFKNAFRINPFGFLIALIMVLSPLWILFDTFTRKESFFIHYQKMEKLLQRPAWYLPLALLVLMNWIWNISKSL